MSLFFTSNLERVKGIEPSQPAWKAGVLPLNYTRIIPNVSHSLVAQNFIDPGGGGRIRTFEDRSQRVYSPPHLTTLVPLLNLGVTHTRNKAFNNKVLYACYQINAINDFVN